MFGRKKKRKKSLDEILMEKAEELDRELESKGLLKFKPRSYGEQAIVEARVFNERWPPDHPDYIYLPTEAKAFIPRVVLATPISLVWFRSQVLQTSQVVAVSTV